MSHIWRVTRSTIALNPPFNWFSSYGSVEKRRAAFERVEKILGTGDNTKLPRCYRGYNREDAYHEGLEEGKVALNDGLHYNHDVFEHITPRYQLLNSR